MLPLRYKILYALSWIPAALIKLALAIIGLPIVWIAIKWRGVDSDFWPKVFWLWANDEDPRPPGWYGGSAWEWFAIRNPVNNMRFLFDDEGKFGFESDWFYKTLDETPMEPEYMLKVRQLSAYRWTWRRWMAGYRYVWIGKNDRYSEIWLGWKVGSGVPGLGFTVQLRFNRRIGT